MSTQERRQSVNQGLREQIERIQLAQQRLRDSADLLEQHALQNARLGQSVWPDSFEAKQDLRHLFLQQREALNELKHEFFAMNSASLAVKSLISVEEMNALLAHQPEV